ncbi:hypothetical protein ES703_79154 [subsurface metagenome]
MDNRSLSSSIATTLPPDSFINWIKSIPITPVPTTENISSFRKVTLSTALMQQARGSTNNASRRLESVGILKVVYLICSFDSLIY